MKEQLITYETAKLAKKKGFVVYVRGMAFYSAHSEGIQFFDGDAIRGYPDSLITHKNTYFAPTQSLLQKWLRETHHIHVEVNADFDNGTKEIWEDNFVYTVKKEGYIKENFYGKTYEECLEYALELGLKLIKEEK